MGWFNGLVCERTVSQEDRDARSPTSEVVYTLTLTPRTLTLTLTTSKVTTGKRLNAFVDLINATAATTTTASSAVLLGNRDYPSPLSVPVPNPIAMSEYMSVPALVNQPSRPSTPPPSVSDVAHPVTQNAYRAVPRSPSSISASESEPDTFSGGSGSLGVEKKEKDKGPSKCNLRRRPMGL